MYLELLLGKITGEKL